MATFSFYKQLDQMDCGPTCLRMVAKHHGRSYTIQTLRDKSQIGKDGVSMLGIAEAAEAIGLRSLGVKISFEKLVTEAPLPCIVHWDQNHFVVVYAIKNVGGWINKIHGGRSVLQPKDTLNSSPLDPLFEAEEVMFRSSSVKSTHSAPRSIERTIYVADPGRGLITYSSEEFCDHWISAQTARGKEGVVLLLETTPSFYEQEGDPLTAYGFGRVMGYIWQYKRLLVQLLIGLGVGSGLQLLFPFLTQSVVDIGVNTQNIPFVYLVLAAQLMLMAGRLSVEFIRSWILLHISTRVNLSILSDFLIKLMNLPVSFFDTKQFGDLMQRIGDHHRIEAFLTGQTITVLFSLLNLIIFSLVLALFSLPIFGIFVTASLLYVCWVSLFLKQRRKLDLRRFDISSKNQSNLIQLIQGMQDIKLAGAERPMRWVWERLQARLFRLQMKVLTVNQYQQAGAFAINEGKNIFITFFAAKAVIDGQLTLGAMLAMQQIVGQLNSPIEQLIMFIQGLQDAKISLERLNEIHMLPDEEPLEQPLIREWTMSTGLGSTTTESAKQSSIRNNRTNNIVTNSNLTIRNLTFHYPGAGNDPVLQDIDLSIMAGKTTAIVGTSGSGKTTLLKLLLRFYEPIKGEIRLGDVSLRNVGHSFWRSQCGVVMQEGYLFSDSIARNIAVGVDRIDAARLNHAIQVANLQQFVESLPSNLHTKIGAEGNGISQGQRQRILIARSVYKDPQYIFFDEATNALDSINEAVIMKNLDEFFSGRTVVIVAHRLSTVCQADQIVVLNKSKLTEIGTHAELVEKRGDYWKLVKNQLELGM